MGYQNLVKRGAFAMTIEEAFEGWVLDLRMRRRSERTIEQYKSVVGAFLRYVGPRDVQEVTSPMLRLYVASALASTHNAETLKREIGCIKTFGKWLEDQEIVERDPFSKVKKPQTDHPERRIVSPRDAQAIFAAFDRDSRDEARDYVLVQLTLDTGLRVSEVCGAKIGDLNLEQGWLQVWGKGRKQRRVPLSPAVKMLLWKWIKGDRRRWAKTDYLFVSRLGGPLDRHRVSGRFRAKVQQAGVQYRVRFHDLRHAAATYALRAGMPKERVSRMLGHANDSITSIYEHLDFEDIQSSHAGANPLRLLE
jgi:integrase/recombinase XerD